MIRAQYITMIAEKLQSWRHRTGGCGFCTGRGQMLT